MTHYPWFKNTSKIDYTGYREFLSLMRYVHASRAYYSNLSPTASGKKTEARQAMLYTHRAMLKAKSFLVHYKPKSALIRRLVYIEWQYLLKSNQLWMPRISLAEPLGQTAKEEMDHLTWGYLRRRKSAVRNDDLDSCIEQILMCLLMRDRSSAEHERTKISRASILRRSLILARKRINIDFNEMVEQCDSVTSRLLLSPQRAWDYKQSLVISADRLLGVCRHLLGILIGLGEREAYESQHEILIRKVDDIKLELIKAQYVSAKTILLFHFPEIIATYEKRGQV